MFVQSEPTYQPAVPGLVIGCDTGGTFTDFVMFDPEKPELGLVTAKVSSTPDDPSRAILEGLRQLSQGRPVAELCHATTVATNTLLEGTGGRVGYLVTEGFGDSLWLARGDRQHLYALQPSRPAPPLSRDDVWEVKERVGASGEILVRLEPDEIERLRNALKERDDLQAIAVCLFHSSLFPEHELLLEHLSHQIPVFLSHRVAPVPGEFERGMTTVLAATLAPKVDDYLARLEKATRGSRLWIVHSSGGLLQPEEARQNPHRLALSGPAAGLRGALSLAQSQGVENIITLDMGGTSSDVALCHADLPYVWETEIEGYPLRAPSLEIHTIGAGGGSIAYRDEGGFLRVGPRSAGAQPGPACYGRGGTEPTVTDALCWAGFLPDSLGTLPLDRESSGRALQKLAAQLGLSLEQTAAGVLTVAVGHLGLAVRKVSTGRGHDPQAFSLLPFGGAGPLLCTQVAEALEMRSVLVPASAGVLSAWGALTAPWEREWSASVPPSSRNVPEDVLQFLQELRSEVSPPFDGCQIEPLIARRYQGQGDTLVSSPDVSFHALHRQRFGFERPDTTVETLEVRWRCRGVRPFLKNSSTAASPWKRGDDRQLLNSDGNTIAATYRGTLSQGKSVTGPFLHFGADSTLFVGPGWSAEGLVGGHLRLTRP